MLTNNKQQELELKDALRCKSLKKKSKWPKGTDRPLEHFKLEVPKVVLCCHCRAGRGVLGIGLQKEGMHLDPSSCGIEILAPPKKNHHEYSISSSAKKKQKQLRDM